MTEEEALREAAGIVEPQAPPTSGKGNKKKMTEEEAFAEAGALPTPRRETWAPEMGLAQGLLRTAIATPGALSSIREWVSSLPAHTPQGQWLKENVSVPPIPGIYQALTGPTSQELLGMWDTNVMPFNEVKGPAAVTERIGEMYMPGPGGKAQAARDAFAAIGAGLGSKGGEELAKGMGAGETGQSWSDFIGSLLGIAASRGRKPTAVKIAAEGAPSQQQIENATTNAYAKVENVPLDKAEFDKVLADINSMVKKRQSPGVMSDLNRLGKGDKVSFKEVNELASEAGRKSAYNKDNPDFSHANKIIARRLDDYFKVAAPQNKDFVPQLNEAKELGRAQGLSRDLNTAEFTSRNAPESGVGPTIARENKVRALANRRPGRLTDVEEEAIHQATGTANPLRRTARAAQGMLAQGGGILGSLIGSGITGGLMAAPLLTTAGAGAAGWGIEKYLNKKSRRRLDDLAAAVRAGRPAQQKAKRTAAEREAQRRQALLKNVLNALRVNMVNRGQE